MKRTIFLLFFMHLMYSICAQKPNALQLNLSFIKDRLGLLDPWEFSLHVTNIGSHKVSVYPLEITHERSSNYGYLALEILNIQDTVWEKTQCILNMHKEFENPSIFLNPKEFIKATFFCPPSSLLKTGTLEVRAIYAPYGIGDTSRLYSNIVTVELEAYKGEDLLAYKYISSLPKPDFFLYPTCAIDEIIDTSYIKHSEYIITKFPNAIFTPFNEVFASLIYYGKAYDSMRENKNTEKTLTYLRESKKLALSASERSNLRVKESASKILSWPLNSIIFPLYDYDPPADVEREFTFPFKH